MTFGSKVPRGHLPVYSVGTDEEAEALLRLACPTNIHGRFVAPELAEEQTLENLQRFSDRLDAMHDRLVEAGRCACEAHKTPMTYTKRRSRTKR